MNSRLVTGIICFVFGFLFAAIYLHRDYIEVREIAGIPFVVKVNRWTGSVSTQSAMPK